MTKSDEIIKRLQDANIRYWAGDNISEVLKEGDIVKIVSMRPKSKNKRWRVSEIVRESIKIG